MDQENKKAMLDHPVFAAIINKPVLVSSHVADFEAYAEELCAACDRERWQEGHYAHSDEEKIYKGWRLHLATQDPMGCGQVRALGNMLLERSKLSENAVWFTFLAPLLNAYRYKNIFLQPAFQKPVVITEKELQKADNTNAEIVDFTLRAVLAYPKLHRSYSFIEECAQRAAYSAPGRVTRYHAKLAGLVLTSALARKFDYQMSHLYAMSENVLIHEEWKGDADLSREIEAIFDPSALRTTCPRSCLWDFMPSDEGNKNMPFDLKKKLFQQRAERSALIVKPG